MAFKKVSVWKNLDWITVLVYLILVVVGSTCIYSAGYNYDEIGWFDLSQRFGKQLMWIGLAFILAFIILLIDRDFYEFFSYFLYAGIIVLLIVTIIIAPEIKGSRSWLILGPVQIQPAEFAKFATALALANFMGTYNFKLLTWKNSFIVALIILLPMLLILLQNETGSALVYGAFLLVLYREGMSGMILFMGLSAIIVFILTVKFGYVPLEFADKTSLGELSVVLFALISSLLMLKIYRPEQRKLFNRLSIILLVFLISSIALILLKVNMDYAYLGYVCIGVFALILFYQALYNKVRDFVFIGFFSLMSIGFMFSVDYIFNDILQPHQQMRIKVLLGIEEDIMKHGYNVNQSKIAIGSGGVWGKGFLNGTQTKLKYVPEQDTDFIFCTIGEEQGFVGAVLIILLFAVLLLRILTLAERQQTSFGRIYGYSVFGIILFHLTINVGMVIGIAPVIGIPLPFFSYGGSSLWAFTILLFIFLRIDAANEKKH